MAACGPKKDAIPSESVDGTPPTAYNRVRRGALDRTRQTYESAPIAQLDRAFGYGPKGWGFKSSWAHHLLQDSIPWVERKSMQLSRVRYSALCLTHRCNLRCSYCYSGEKVQKNASLDAALRAIDFLHEASGGSCIVTFFGGEPLLEFALMKEIVAYSRRTYDRRVKFRMSTNGTLLTREILEELKKNEIFFVLSIDGNEEQHDHCRRFADGRGSYEATARRLEEVFRFNPYTIAVSVVVPETVEYVAAGVEDLFERGFRYVVQTLDYSAAWEKAHLEALKRQYAALADFYRESLKKGRKIYYSPFDERIKTWAQKPYEAGSLCDLANTQIAIAASGCIYPCVQFIGGDETIDRRHAIGDVFEGFDESKRRLYVEQNYAEKKPCVGCAHNGRCATYCGCVNWRATGCLSQIPAIVCEHERMLMPIVDRMASRLWKDRTPLFRRKFYEKTFAMSSYIEDCALGGKE